MLKPQTISTNAIKNPTNLHPEQFIGPFNILPDTKFKNPAAGIIKNPTVNFTSNVWAAGKAVHTNVNLKNTGANLLGLAALSAGSIVGIPQIGQVGQAVIESAENTLSGRYTTLPFISLTNNIVGTRIPSGILYPDFRSKLNIDPKKENAVSTGDQILAFGATRRLDGYSAALRGSIKAGVYASLTATPVGAYSTFNLDGGSISGYGWGDHDNPNAVRKDFTMRSHIAKRWFNGKFKPTVNPVELATPFRGDRVNVIDFSKRKLKDAYLWNPRLQSDEFLGMDLNPLSITQDFIKFYLTGPSLQAGSTGKDDIIVFRASISSLTDTFSPNWTPQQMIGRADPNYIYTGFSRAVALSFDIYATDRDEMQPIYRKLNGLAGYTTPTYNPDSITMEGPWMRLTVGDLFYQQPVVITSLTYTYGMDAPWEINIEDDPNMMQAPMKISVQIGFNMISDYLPQKGGRFFTLAKRFQDDATPKTGRHNWLGDTLGNFNAEDEKTRWEKWREKQKSNNVPRSKTVGDKFSSTMTADELKVAKLIDEFGPKLFAK